MTRPGFNDLATSHPDLAAEALFDPTAVVAQSNRCAPWRCAAGHEWEATVYNRTKGNGCPFCSGRSAVVGVNDLATTHPQLASEALFDATGLSAGSGKQVRWRCALGHEWRTTPHARASGYGCPVCSNYQVLVGFNDLATTHPEVAAEALFDPTTVVAGSGSRRQWRCSHGHVWIAPVSRRTRGRTGCPYCANQRVLPGFNDLASIAPEIAAEALFDATSVVYGSPTKRRWRCAEGHEWSTSPEVRMRGNGCPTCAKYGYDVNKKGWLYLISNASEDLLQIGITNDPGRRLGVHSANGWTSLDIRGPMDGVLTRDWESAILSLLRRSGVPTGRSAGFERFAGYTESWRRSDWPARTIRELMDAVEREEES